MRRKRSGRRRFIALLVGMAVVLVILGYAMLTTYSERIQRQLFSASATNLEDTYAEAILVFDEMTTSRWNYLTQVALFLENTEDDAQVGDYIRRLQTTYGFTEFYLLNDGGRYMTVDGNMGYVDLGDTLFDLIDDGDRIVTDGSLPGRENMFFYAVPVDVPGTYQDFDYCAVAFGYDKEDLSSAMDLTAYNGESDSYLVYPNGRVCITMGDVDYDVRNVLSSLESIGTDEADLAQITQDLQDGATNTFKIDVEGTAYYLSYQSTELSDWRLVSLTPVSVVDRDINTVRATTTSMMLGLGTMLLVLVGVAAFYWGWRNLHDIDSMLAEREMIFATMSERMDEIYLLYDDELGAVQYVSPNAERLLGVTTREIYEVPGAITQCVAEQDAWNDRTELEALAPGGMMHREYHLTNQRTGETRPFAIDLYRSDDPAHAHTLILSMTDNTQEYAARAEITAAMESARAANAAKSSFLSSMSHDIRTPMNAIIGFTTLLDRDAEDPAQVRHYTERIRTSGNHLLALIGDVLDISKIEAGNVTLEPEETSLSEIAEQVEDLVRPQADAKRQNLTIRYDIHTGGTVMVDRMRLVQILQNLLSNAVKYTQDGGDIELNIVRRKDKNTGTTPDRDPDKGTFSTYQFIVRDNGMGMTEEFQEKIFLPFTRATDSTVNKIQGTGLGMAITKEIVDLMGGTIRLQSRLHEGSTFTVTLDLRTVNHSEQDAASEAASAAAAAEPAASETAYSMAGLHVLAAEDNEINAEILEELLGMEGVTCTIVHNGQEAVEAFEAATPGQYDLILMDVQMPVMDGYDATRAIRASVVNPEGTSIPIIAMTANAFSEDVQNALAAGMNAHLSKPMNMEALRQTACSLVGRCREAKA